MRAVGFTMRPLGMLAAMDDASLRGVVLDSDLVEAGVASYGEARLAACSSATGGCATRAWHAGHVTSRCALARLGLAADPPSSKPRRRPDAPRGCAEKKAMFSVTWRGSDMGAIWSMAVQPAMQVGGQRRRAGMCAGAAAGTAARPAGMHGMGGRGQPAHCQVMPHWQGFLILCSCPWLQFVAYGGEDGVVGVFRADYEPAARRRQHHTAVAGAATGAAGWSWGCWLVRGEA